MQYVVYILRTSANTLYIGQTNDIDRRITEHKTGKKGAKYMRLFTSFELVYTEPCDSRSQALKREHKLRLLTKAQKEALVQKFPLAKSARIDAQ